LAVAVVLIYLRCSSKLKMVFSVALLGGAGVLALASLRMGDIFSDVTGKDMTLTGRTPLWALVVNKIAERPILGYGYDAFWRTQGDAINQFLTWKPGQAHNGYLDICLNLGVVGLFLVLFLIRDGMRRAVRLRSCYGDNAGLAMLVALILLLVRNCAEASFLDISVTWLVLLISYFSSWKQEAALITDLTWRRADYDLAYAAPSSGAEVSVSL
jgi:exopolysaccharide production protein ExoQ